MGIASQRGQAGVEALVVLPLLVLVGAIALQALLLAAAAVAAEAAAGAGARALARGDDPLRAARAALPGALVRSLRVEVREGAVIVVVAPTILVPGWPGHTIEAVER
jgi:glyoxylase-like metal-dependent hydrolase (beta-lactamase superfamily II)